MFRVKLIRHAEVEAVWKKICYGQMDVPLSTPGRFASQTFAELLPREEKPIVVFHSGLSRTRVLADAIAARWSPTIPVRSDARLLERNYGQWQGKSWDEIFAADPEHFHDLVEHPETYRPASGETTTEMQQRMVEWYQSLNSYQHDGPAPSPLILAISHSGPIAALAGYVYGAHARDWQPWMVGYLEALDIIL